MLFSLFQKKNTEAQKRGELISGRTRIGFQIVWLLSLYPFKYSYSSFHHSLYSNIYQILMMPYVQYVLNISTSPYPYYHFTSPNHHHLFPRQLQHLLYFFIASSLYSFNYFFTYHLSPLLKTLLLDNRIDG